VGGQWSVRWPLLLQWRAVALCSRCCCCQLQGLRLYLRLPLQAQAHPSPQLLRS